MKLINDYPDEIYLGRSKDEGGLYFLKPTWNSWYWHYGYLRNGKEDILHINYLKCKHQNSLPMSLKEEFDLYFRFKELPSDDLYTFCEISETICSLKNSAEMFLRGGYGHIDNPNYDLIKRDDWVDTINNVIIPKQIDSLYNILLSFPELD